MFINKNVQMLLCNLAAAEQNANTEASEVSSQTGSLAGGMLRNLYAYWEKILASDYTTDSNKQEQYSMDSTAAQNQESYVNAVVTSINTNVSNLGTSMKSLSAYSSTIIQFMQSISSLIQTRLG
ncbi:MAG: hypothetical protein AAF443_01365 [Chlamydiota bacterium]